MANVTISIPGVGKVTATNAATEDTLIKILHAIEKSGVSGASGAALGGSVARTSVSSSSATANAAVSEKSKFLVTAFTALGAATANLGKSIIALGTQMITAYDAMANDPIGAAAGIVNTAIDMVGNFAKGVGSAIPVIGGLVSAAAEAAAALAKMANDIFAAEFKKSVEALNSYTKAGASFAGGMTEMRTIANNAGYSLQTLSKAAAASTDDIRAAGFSQGEGVKQLADGMGAAAKTVGRSGNTLRNEMLAMGYSYEEQGAIMSQYMAQMKASGQLEKMSKEEIAKGTRDYAKNLKVISDITGQDAKKLLDKARLESMRGALAGKMDAKQQEAYKNAHAQMMAMGAEAGPQFQEALTQYLATGTITNPAIAANAEMVAMIKKTGDQVMSGNADMTTQTVSNLAEMSTNIKKSGESAVDTAALLSKEAAGGMPGQMAILENAARGFQLNADAGKESMTAAEKQAMATDGTTKGFIALTEQTEKFRAQMEELVGNNLPAYAQLLANAHKEAVDAMYKFLDGTADAVNAFDQLIQDIRTLGIWGAFEKYAKLALDKFVDAVQNNVGKSLAIAGGLLAALLVKKFGGQMLGAAGRGIGGALGFGGSKAAPTIAGSAGNAAGIGGSLGSEGGGSFLKNLAAGLKAIGEPRALLGLGAVTLAIMGIAKAAQIAAPAFEPLGQALKSMLEGVGSIVEKAGPAISSIIVGLGVSVKTVIDSISNFVPKLVPIIETVGSSISNIISNIGAAVSNTISSIGSGIENAASGIGEIIDSVGSSVSSIVSSIGQLIFDTGAGISSVVESIGTSINTVLGGINGTITSISTGLSTVITTIQDSIVTVIDALTKSITDLSKISGTDLLAVSGGVGALGVALIPFAAGGALAGLVAKAGGFKNITDGLHDFEALDAEKLTAVAEAMGKVKESMPSVAQLTAAAATGFFDKFTEDEQPSTTSATSDTTKISESGDVFVQIVEHLQQQISQQQEMIAYLRDQKDISFRILQATN